MGNIGEPQRVIEIPKPQRAPVVEPAAPERQPEQVPVEPERVPVP